MTIENLAIFLLFNVLGFVIGYLVIRRILQDRK